MNQINKIPELKHLNYDSSNKYLEIDELKIIYKLLEHEFIPYNNLKFLDLIRKIRLILEQHELNKNDT